MIRIQALVVIRTDCIGSCKFNLRSQPRRANYEWSYVSSDLSGKIRKQNNITWKVEKERY
jgi:hypothetical protein